MISTLAELRQCKAILEEVKEDLASEGVPFDPNVVTCGDNGKSYQDTYPDSPVTQAYESIARKIGSLISG